MRYSKRDSLGVVLLGMANKLDPAIIKALVAIDYALDAYPGGIELTTADLETIANQKTLIGYKGKKLKFMIRCQTALQYTPLSGHLLPALRGYLTPDNITDAAPKTVRYGVWKEAVVAIDVNNVAYITLTEEALKCLNQ